MSKAVAYHFRIARSSNETRFVLVPRAQPARRLWASQGREFVHEKLNQVVLSFDTAAALARNRQQFGSMEQIEVLHGVAIGSPSVNPYSAMVCSQRLSGPKRSGTQ